MPERQPACANSLAQGAALSVMGHLNNMKKFILIAIFFTQLFYSFCQNYGTIEGVVFDSAENIVIAYANLVLIKADIATASDKEGKFIFNNMLAGEDILKCSLIGYGTPRRLNIKIYADSTTFIKINLAKCQYDIMGLPNCPICNRTDETIPILYGEPTKKSLRRAKKGKIKLGGCLITHCDPHWYCKRDKISF